jgi:adenine-specific DNA-methyltransferase
VAPRAEAARAELGKGPAERAPSAPARRFAVGSEVAESRLVLGDNLHVLEWLRAGFEGRFRCAYIDPPFNTGRVFREYDDARSPAEWRTFLRERLVRIAPLLSHDGVLFLEIDDSELGAAIALCDEVFGRSCRLSTVTLVRSGATGHKAKNRGPVNVTDFILVYERAPGAFRCRPMKRPRRGFDPAYRTYLVNPEAPCRDWEFRSLGSVVAKDAGFGASRAAKRALGDAVFEARLAAFALAHAGHVVRFAQPRYEAVSRAAQKEIDASREDSGRVRRLVRPGHPDLLLLNGNRILFLASKVEATATGPRLVEPLTNVWDDIPFQGIAREGGVTFTRNKKPERLIERILRLATDEGDWVLDPFVGSGTTAAVAEKMGRRWVGIEEGEVFWSLAVPRLGRVVRGEDETGIGRLRARGAAAGPPGFSVYG